MERFVLIGVVCSSGGLACGEDETRLTPYDLPQLPPASTGGSPVESPNQPAAGGSGSEAPGGVDPAGTSTEDPIGDPATHPEAEDAPDGDPDATARDGGTNVDADAGPGTNIPPASRDAATEIDEEPDASTGIEEPVDEPIEEPDAGGAIGGEDDPLAPYEPGLTDRPEATPFLALPPRAQSKLRGWDVEEVFRSLTFSNATFIIEVPGGGWFFVTEREGRIYAFEKRPDVSERRLVLDITSQTLANGDKGLVSLAFHPEFGVPDSPNRGYIYIHYPYIPAPVTPGSSTTPSFSRLSRFTLDPETFQADPGSELVLIDQYDQHPLHLGGALFFHPVDGYLYLTVGDEGLSCSVSDNCGRVDKNLFSGVLRIDVNPVEDDDSHAIVRQPQDGATANYTIPNDNPFVGQADALEEFYALGLRSPHRMTHDAVDDITWIGDVGEIRREEIDVLESGANFQWHAYEGFFRRRTPRQPSVGVWTDPLIDFTRAEVQVVIGGYTYRGSRFPELYGKYIFADFWSNNLFALPYTLDAGEVRAQPVEQLGTNVGAQVRTLTSFGVDADGELYVTSLGRDRIKALTFREQASTNLPRTLSATGTFQDTAALVPSPALLPYDVQSPLWSDGADKRRWMALPSGTNITFAENGAWGFPEGTVFVKHFEMAMDERRPEELRRLETRVLVAGQGGSYYGASYKWNAAGTEAELLLESQLEALEIVQPDTTLRRQEYFYPGPNDCLVCHNPEAGHVLGVRTAQLNGETIYEDGGQPANQLATWSALGLFDQALSIEEIQSFPKLAALGDEDRSIEDRVRSYWDSNCSMCHGVIEGLRANWDARFETPLVQQAVVSGPSVGVEGGFVVVPGDPEASLMFQRDSATEAGIRMPPLGRTRTDLEYIELLELWIDSLGAPAPPAADAPP